MAGIINESNIRKAYHWTTIGALKNMVELNMLSMSNAYYSGTEMRLSKSKYPFYLSTTQYATEKEGYAKEIKAGGKEAVLLELNMDYLANKGVFKRVQYHKDAVRPENAKWTTKYYESEDRFLTAHSSLPFDKVVLSVDSKGRRLPAPIIADLRSMGISVRGNGSELVVPDIRIQKSMCPPISLLPLIMAVWGRKAMNDAYMRIEALVDFDLEDVNNYRKDGCKYYDWNDPIIKEMMRPIFVKAMKADIPFDILNSALFGLYKSDEVTNLFK